MKQLYGLPQAFGKVIAEARIRQNLSQEQLADLIDSTNVYISMLENGQRQPSLNAVILIAQALQESPESIVEKTFRKLMNTTT